MSAPEIPSPEGALADEYIKPCHWLLRGSWRGADDVVYVAGEEDPAHKPGERDAKGQVWVSEPLYTADQLRAALAAQPTTKLEDIEQYRMQMAGISTAALGYWKDGDGIRPDYDTLALRDVAKLYAKYDALHKEKVEALTTPAPQAPVALTDEQIRDVWAEKVRWHGPPIGLTDLDFAHDAIAEFCRVNGIPAPQTKEPTNDR